MREAQLRRKRPNRESLSTTLTALFLFMKTYNCEPMIPPMLRAELLMTTVMHLIERSL